MSFDELSYHGKLSAIYGQVLELRTKVNDLLAREAHLHSVVHPEPAKEQGKEDHEART